MSGHSKWSTIKRDKGVNDQKKGATFTKLVKNITSAVKTGGGADLEMNFKLRLAVEKARAASMPKANVENAIKKAAGEEAGTSHIDEILYEGFGPEGVAIMVEVLTDNRNRAASEVRHAFSKHGGTFGESGCVAYLFKPRGSIFVPLAKEDQESAMLELMEFDVEDIEASEKGLEVLTSVDHLGTVRKAIQAAGLTVQDMTIMQDPVNKITIDQASAAQRIMTLIEAIEESEDVQAVFTNADIDDRVLAEIGLLGGFD